MIRHLLNEEIDKRRWDACVTNSSAPFVYSESWFLDIVSPGWEGLVSDDYEAVFPLAVRKRLGIRYVFQPPFSQQLGSFGSIDADQFLHSIPKDIKLVDMQLNESNSCNHFKSEKRPNLSLSLASDIDSIRKNYSENLRRNLKRSSKADFVPTDNIGTQELIRLFRECRGKSIGQMNDREYGILEKIVATAVTKKRVEFQGLRDTSGRLLAGAIFLRSGHGWIFFFSATHPLGRETGAMSSVIDRFIERHTGENTT
ncbi:MAG: hypothetical protein ACKOA1_01170, partial [Bacteroidota bacterium]